MAELKWENRRFTYGVPSDARIVSHDGTFVLDSISEVTLAASRAAAAPRYFEGRPIKASPGAPSDGLEVSLLARKRELSLLSGWREINSHVTAFTGEEARFALYYKVPVRDRLSNRELTEVIHIYPVCVAVETTSDYKTAGADAEMRPYRVAVTPFAQITPDGWKGRYTVDPRQLSWDNWRNIYNTLYPADPAIPGRIPDEADLDIWLWAEQDYSSGNGEGPYEEDPTGEEIIPETDTGPSDFGDLVNVPYGHPYGSGPSGIVWEFTFFAADIDNPPPHDDLGRDNDSMIYRWAAFQDPQMENVWSWAWRGTGYETGPVYVSPSTYYMPRSFAGVHVTLDPVNYPSSRFPIEAYEEDGRVSVASIHRWLDGKPMADIAQVIDGTRGPYKPGTSVSLDPTPISRVHIRFEVIP